MYDMEKTGTWVKEEERKMIKNEWKTTETQHTDQKVAESYNCVKRFWGEHETTISVVYYVVYDMDKSGFAR